MTILTEKGESDLKLGTKCHTFSKVGDEPYGYNRVNAPM